MPIFEYRCDHCGQTQEKIQSKPEKHVPCSACGKQHPGWFLLLPFLPLQAAGGAAYRQAVVLPEVRSKRRVRFNVNNLQIPQKQYSAITQQGEDNADDHRHCS